ncbi:hypothetical protein G5B10_05655 [Fluviicola sp. SGL-29]|nr:hypothetical protein [Fluviicola sp. SGL-29]
MNVSTSFGFYVTSMLYTTKPIPSMNMHCPYFLLIALALTGCREAIPNRADDSQVENTAVITETPEEIAVDLSDYEQLIPIEIVDTTARNSYEKYGIEFSGNCYACDLARIELSQQRLTFINVCDDNDRYEINDISCAAVGKEMRIRADAYAFTLIKIDDAPVYELSITGKNLKLDNKRIATFYTPAKKLHLFKEHDCGDFQG